MKETSICPTEDSRLTRVAMLLVVRGTGKGRKKLQFKSLRKLRSMVSLHIIHFGIFCSTGKMVHCCFIRFFLCKGQEEKLGITNDNVKMCF